MSSDIIQTVLIDELLESSAGERIQQAMEVFASVQEHVYALTDCEDSTDMTMLKIGTVFQVFLVDTLASGKKPSDISTEDWKSIAQNVSKYAVLEKGQCYSEFVFTLYADYIDISASALPEIVVQEHRDAIKELAHSIRDNTELLHQGSLTEADYIEGCLWLSLEAMIKLLATSLTMVIGSEFSQLAQAASQLAFEYGRYVLYAREQAILSAYIQNQYTLDDVLRQQYEEFLRQLQKNADVFQGLIQDAFSPVLHNSLVESAALARAAGVKEEELLTTVDEIDDFFMG